MDISAIIKSLVNAKKIGIMTLSAITITCFTYIINNKTGIIESENKVGILIIFFICSSLLVVALGFLYAHTKAKMKYEHIERMTYKEIEKELNSENQTENSKLNGSSKTVTQGEKSTFIDKNDGNIQINIQ